MSLNSPIDCILIAMLFGGISLGSGALAQQKDASPEFTGTARIQLDSPARFLRHVASLYPGIEPIATNHGSDFYVGIFWVPAKNWVIFSDAPRNWDWKYQIRPRDSVRITIDGSPQPLEPAVPSAEIWPALQGRYVLSKEKSAISYGWPEAYAYHLPPRVASLAVTWKGLNSEWVVSLPPHKTTGLPWWGSSTAILMFCLGAAFAALFRMNKRGHPGSTSSGN